MNIIRKIKLALFIAKDIFAYPTKKEFDSKGHPYHNSPIIEAFKINGVQYYEFVQPSDMPAERYMAMMDFLDERDLMVTRDNLRELLQKQNDAMNAGKFTDAMIINSDLLRMTEMALNFESLYKIASCIYFNLKDNEDLTTYDIDYNLEKIEKFKREKIGNFFLNTRMRRYLPYKNLSDSDLQTFLKIQDINKRKIQPILNRQYEEKR